VIGKNLFESISSLAIRPSLTVVCTELRAQAVDQLKSTTT